MDVFLGRCLKNWAAHQAPPADGRERLLRAASGQTQEKKAENPSPAQVYTNRGLATTIFDQDEYGPGLGNLWAAFMYSTLRMVPCGSSDFNYDSFSSISGNAALIYLLHP